MSTDRLLKLIQRPGWDLLFGKNQLFLHCPSKIEALKVLNYEPLPRQLAIEAAALGYERMVLRYSPLGNKPFRYIPLPACEKPTLPKESIIMPNFQDALGAEVRKNVWISDELDVDDSLIRSIGDIISSPWPAGLTRKRDYRQMVVNKRFSLIMPDSPQESVKKKTNNFIVPADLEDVERMTQLHGSPGNVFEVSYRAALDDEHRLWARLTNRYRVTVDDLGEVYRWAEVIGFDMLRSVPTDVQESRRF